MTKVRVRVDGLKELDAALGELSKGAARGALRRALVKAAEPMRAAAAQNAPELTGALKRSIILSSKVDNRAGKAEYAQTLSGGGSKKQAVQALRDARREQGIGASFAEVFMGPAKGSKRDAIKSLVQEFGSTKQQPQPYMRPAFDSQAEAVIINIKGELATEINKSVQRARKRALKKAGKK